MDGGEDVVGGLGPSEGLGVGIVGVDVGVDGLFELGDGAEHAAADMPLGEQREEALDLVDPGGRWSA